jgi:hypothetical protein
MKSLGKWREAWISPAFSAARLSIPFTSQVRVIVSPAATHSWEAERDSSGVVANVSVGIGVGLICRVGETVGEMTSVGAGVSCGRVAVEDPNGVAVGVGVSSVRVTVGEASTVAVTVEVAMGTSVSSGETASVAAGLVEDLAAAGGEVEDGEVIGVGTGVSSKAWA